MSNILQNAGVAGPVFISVGDSLKLKKFLKVNPKISKEFSFVDDSPEFDAYTNAGFGKIGDRDPSKDFKMKAPKLSGKEWWTYARNVIGVSPVQKGGGFPTGVLRLGGTFVIDDEQVLYAWSDSVPGDVPELQAVFKAMGVNFEM
mmetsp:Transcript_27908/g.38589  ORF Transcript_27908/g.38589 Transcript_27908/m.38589 type:complete len:145 (+) Transcript_27908:442-876(+)